MLGQYYRLKCARVCAFKYENISRRQDLIDFIGDSKTNHLTDDDIVQFKDKFGRLHLVFWGNYVVKHPRLGLTTMSAELFEALYELESVPARIVDIQPAQKNSDG